MRKHMRERLAALAAQAFPEAAPREHTAGASPRGRRAAEIGAQSGGTAHYQCHCTETVATGEGLRQALVGQPASLTVTTKDKDGAGAEQRRAACGITGPDGTRLPVPWWTTRMARTGWCTRRVRRASCSSRCCSTDSRCAVAPSACVPLRHRDLPPSPDDVKRRVSLPAARAATCARRLCGGQLHVQHRRQTEGQPHRG